MIQLMAGGGGGADWHHPCSAAVRSVRMNKAPSFTRFRRITGSRVPQEGCPLNFIWDKITEWLKGLLVSGIISNLSGLFDAINTRVGEAAAVVGTTPQAWHGGIFQMIRSLSENVVVPIAGIILTFIMCLELIQMLIDRNSLHDFDTFLFLQVDFQDLRRSADCHQHMEYRDGGFRCCAERRQSGIGHHHRRYRAGCCRAAWRHGAGADGNGNRPAVRAVVSVLADGHLGVGAEHLHLHRHIWAYD